MADPLDDLENLEDAFPLTGVQAGMLFESLSRPSDGLYTGLVTAALPHDLDLGRFHEAWETVIARHQCLRSLILWEGLDQPVQVVQNATQPDWRHEDWSALSGHEAASRLDALHTALRFEPWDFTAPSPLRLCLVAMQDGYRFAMTCHHALLDNWSVDVVMGDVAEAYHSEPSLLPAPVPYRDFADWLGGQDQEAAEMHWARTLSGFMDPTRLAFQPCAAARSGSHDLSLPLDQSASDDLRRIATELRVTLGTVLAAVWGIVVHRVSDADDILFGLAVTQRPPEIGGIERAVGNFVATLSVRMTLTPDTALRATILELQTARALDPSHSTTPLPQLASLVGLSAGTPLFDTILSIEQPSTPDTPGAPLFGDVQVRDRSEFPLSMFAATGNEITLRAQFDGAVLSQEDAQTMLEAFATALRATPGHLEASAQSLPVMDGARLKAALLGDLGPNLAEVEHLLPAQIEHQMAKTPKATAIVSGDHVLRYKDLRERVGAFQSALTKAGARPGQFIAICLDAPSDMVASMLAVWSLGCAYAPLSAEEPRPRMAAKLAALECELVVACPKTRDRLPPEISTIMLLPDANGDSTQPAIEISGHDPAYVIFTSGSTGTPKGVVVTHANLMASTAARIDWYGEAPERFLLLSPLIFDSSVAGLYWALARGGALVIPDKDTRQTPKALAALIEARRATHTLCLPSVYDLLLDAGTPQQLASLKTVIVAGEPVPPRLAEAHHARVPETTLVNEYGPTEATVWCAAARLQAGVHSAPIGRAIPGTKLILRDRHQRPVLPGLPAELFVGGQGVAAGYLGLADETAAKFVPDPDASAGRLYRTGDLVRQRPDGQLSYIGRADDQLKIRGHRVEPSDIEAAILALSEVAAAAVVRHSLAQELIAYVVPTRGATLDPTEIQRKLASTLPDYMQPSRILNLDALPETPTGKTDRRALAMRALPARPNDATAYPCSATEARLLEIWCTALDCDTPDFGVTDPFFAVGGDSLSAMRLVGRVAEAFDIDLSVAELLGSGLTVQTMAALVDARLAAKGASGNSCDPVSFPVPVTEGLKALWLAARFHPGQPFFNLDIATRLSFAPTPKALAIATAALAEKHGALLLNYHLEDGTLALVPRDGVPDMHCVVHHGANRTEINAWVTDLVAQPFDVSGGPLWRCGLFEAGPDEAILVIVIHHTIADGWSLDLLMEDLVAYLAGDARSVDTATWDTHAFARHVATRDDQTDKAHLAFWSNALSGLTEPARFATDHAMPRSAKPWGHEARRKISRDHEGALRALARERGITLLPIVWATWAALIWKQSGMGDTLVAVSQANRDYARLMDAVGCFTQPLPYRLNASPEMSFDDLLLSAETFSDAARKNASVAVESVIQDLPQTRQTYLTSFAQSALQINDFGAAPMQRDNEHRARPYVHPAAITSLFELSVEWRHGADGLECGILARTDLFRAATVEGLLDAYLDLTQAALAAPGQRLRNFS